MSCPNAVQVLAALRPMRLPASVCGKTAEDGSSTWAPTNHVENQDRVPGFWLQSSPDLAVMVIWGVGQRMKNLPLSFPSPSPSIALPFKEIFEKEKKKHSI